jgi:hypothetical protein
MLSSEQWITFGGLVVGVVNLLLNLRLQLVTLNLKRWTERRLLNHLGEYHGVKIPKDAGA